MRKIPNDNPHIGLECPYCADRIFSEYTHDFKYCACGAIFVDGGKDYLRYGWDPNKVNKKKIKFIEKEKT